MAKEEKKEAEVAATKPAEKSVWGSWKYWLLLVLITINSYFLGRTLQQTFNPDFFAASAGEIVGLIFRPVVLFSGFVAFSTICAMIAAGLSLLLLAAVASLPAFVLFPFPFSLILFLAFGLIFYFYLWSASRETRERIKINFGRILDRGLSIFLALLMLLIAFGLWFLWSEEIRAKGFTLPDRLVENATGVVFEQFSSVVGGGINANSSVDEVLEATVDKFVLPDFEKRLVEAGLPEAEIKSQLEQAKKEQVETLKKELFKNFPNVGDGAKSMKEFIKEGVKNQLTLAGKQIGGYVALGFSFVLFLLLETFAYLFVWLATLIAWAVYGVVRLVRFITIGKEMKEVEIAKF